VCDNCGCNITHGNEHLLGEGGKLHQVHGELSVEVLENLLHENDHQASHNREHFEKHRVLAINLMSSPGSGKTTLLQKALPVLGKKYRVAVVEGDLETENDAQRLRDAGVEAIQITTGSACHLDSHMVHDALHKLNLAELDIVFIENVGNLVCPASFDLGHHLNVVMLSVTEGDDKPSKYPVMFRAADLMLITKTDLLPYLDDFSCERAEMAMSQLAKPIEIIQVSARNEESYAPWIAWIEQQWKTRYEVAQSA